MSDPGDYYDRKRAEAQSLRAQIAKLEAEECEVCGGDGFYTTRDHYGERIRDVCDDCVGRTNKIRNLRKQLELARYVGD